MATGYLSRTRCASLGLWGLALGGCPLVEPSHRYAEPSKPYALSDAHLLLRQSISLKGEGLRFYSTRQLLLLIALRNEYLIASVTIKDAYLVNFTLWSIWLVKHLTYLLNLLSGKWKGRSLTL